MKKSDLYWSSPHSIFGSVFLQQKNDEIDPKVSNPASVDKKEILATAEFNIKVDSTGHALSGYSYVRYYNLS
jgi:hypothetical protein